jgi:adenylate kinase family enzyme
MTARGDPVSRLASADRILVLGPSGSGKTYLSRRMAPVLGHEVIHLDRRFWRPGWVATPQAEWREAVRAMVDLRVPAADAIVLIERSRAACLWGVLRRTLANGRKPRPDAPAGQPIDRAFLRYVWRYPTHTRPQVDAAIARHGPDKNVIVVKGSRGIQALLAELRVV